MPREGLKAVEGGLENDRRGDLVGVIWDSVDRHSHAAQAREATRDYRGCTLSFRWRSEGVTPLDAVVTTGTGGMAEKRSLGNSITQVDVADVTAKTTVVKASSKVPLGVAPQERP